MDFIALFFVGSTLSLMATYLIEALIVRRPALEDRGREFSAQSWVPRAYGSKRTQRRRRLHPAVRKRFETAQQASKPLKVGEG